MDLCVVDVMIEGEIRSVTIWDTAGQERYKTVTNSYYRQADIDSERKISREEAEAFASQHFMPFYEVSART